MPRIKLVLPERFSFSAYIPVRITDLNYGAHVGNDTILTLLHEARVQYLQSRGYSELNVAGASLIMGDVAIEFKKELFYGKPLKAYVAAAAFTRAGFDLYYRLVVDDAGRETEIAVAKTGMVCFDYSLKKIVALPDEAVRMLSEH